MNEIWERVLANSFSGIHKSKIICSVLGVLSGVANGSTVYNLHVFDLLQPSIFDSPYFSACLHPAQWLFTILRNIVFFYSRFTA
jgi:hypothetical protein